MGADQSVILKGGEGDLYAHRINMFFGECKLKGEDGEAALQQFFQHESVQNLLGQWAIPEPKSIKEAQIWIFNLDESQTRELNDALQEYLYDN